MPEKRPIWHIEASWNPSGRKFYWLMSGTRTLGQINSERIAKQIVKDHNHD